MLFFIKIMVYKQRWSARGRPWPRGHIFKSLASKLKSLALRGLRKCPVLGWRKAFVDSHFIWLGSGTDLVSSGNKARFRSGLKLANVQPDLNPIKTRGSMQSRPDRACGSDSDLST